MKVLLITAFSSHEDVFGVTYANIGEYLESEYYDWTECHSCTLITHDDLIRDLERFYAGSHSRLGRHLQKYKERIDLNKRLKEADDTYLGYISYLKNHTGIEQIVRINQLGKCENSAHSAKSTIYFMLYNRRLYLLALSDFA